MSEHLGQRRQSRPLSLQSFFLRLVTVGIVLVPLTARAATLVVDADGQATAGNCSATSAAFTSIQAAVTAAAAGDIIEVCPGIYDEQVVVTTNNLTIRGAGAGLTVLRPSVVSANTTSVPFGTPVFPVLLVNGAANVTIARLTVDGSLGDGGAIDLPQCPVLPFYVGIYFRNSSGTVDTAHITRIQSATRCAFGIRADVSSTVITRSLLDRYGQAGISCTRAGSRCTITNNTVRGRGRVSDETQAGIVIRSAAAGVISGNIISDHFRIGAHGVPESAVGIFLVNAQPTSNPHLVQNNVFVNNQVNIQRISTAAAF